MEKLRLSFTTRLYSRNSGKQGNIVELRFANAERCANVLDLNPPLNAREYREFQKWEARFPLILAGNGRSVLRENKSSHINL